MTGRRHSRLISPHPLVTPELKWSATQFEALSPCPNLMVYGLVDEEDSAILRYVNHHDDDSDSDPDYDDDIEDTIPDPTPAQDALLEASGGAIVHMDGLVGGINRFQRGGALLKKQSNFLRETLIEWELEKSTAVRDGVDLDVARGHKKLDPILNEDALINGDLASLAKKPAEPQSDAHTPSAERDKPAPRPKPEKPPPPKMARKRAHRKPRVQLGPPPPKPRKPLPSGMPRIAGRGASRAGGRAPSRGGAVSVSLPSLHSNGLNASFILRPLPTSLGASALGGPRYGAERRAAQRPRQPPAPRQVSFGAAAIAAPTTHAARAAAHAPRLGLPTARAKTPGEQFRRHRGQDPWLIE